MLYIIFKNNLVLFFPLQAANNRVCLLIYFSGLSHCYDFKKQIGVVDLLRHTKFLQQNNILKASKHIVK